MNTYRTFSAVAVLLLAGCDAVTNQAAELAAVNEPTIVIGAGYPISVDGRAVPIQGFDECPKADSAMVKLFGPNPSEGKATCIVLSKDRQKVPVLVALSAGAVKEDWDIVRDTGKLHDGRTYGRTILRRPDGSLVVPGTGTRP